MCTPVWIVPPCSPSTFSRLRAMDCEPPSATAHPAACPAVRMPSPIADVNGWVSGRNACAATPAHSACAWGF